MSSLLVRCGCNVIMITVLRALCIDHCTSINSHVIEMSEAILRVASLLATCSV